MASWADQISKKALFSKNFEVHDRREWGSGPMAGPI